MNSTRSKGENMANKEQYRAVLEDLFKQRSQLQFKIGEIEAALAALRRLMPAEEIVESKPEEPQPTLQGTTIGKYAGMGVRWAILRLLSEDAVKPMPTGEIADTLQNGGITSGSKNFAANVSAVLSDMNRIRGEVIWDAEGKGWTISEKGKEVWIHIKASQTRNQGAISSVRPSVQ
jgi:hypothetical protein